MKVVVILITQYKESDGIINAISEDGPISFFARGIMNPKSKNASALNVLSVVDVELLEGKIKYPILKRCSLLYSPYKINNSLNDMAVISLIAEATRLLISDEEKHLIFNDLACAIESIKENKISTLMVLLIYLLRVFNVTGYKFEVNKCVNCGSTKDITSFSFVDGGFICRNCQTFPIKHPLTNEEMLLLRDGFILSSYKQSKYFNEDNIKNIMLHLKHFIIDSYGCDLKSFGLLL